MNGSLARYTVVKMGRTGPLNLRHPNLDYADPYIHVLVQENGGPMSSCQIHIHTEIQS